MTAPIVVRAENVSKNFRVQKSERTVLRAARSMFSRASRLHMSYPVLQDVSFEIRHGEAVGVLGRNGSGKSTLLRLMAGILAATSGKLELTERPPAVFTGEAGLTGDLPVVDNIHLFGAVLGIGRDVLIRNETAILALSGLTELRYARTKELSSGQRRRLALSIFFHCEHDFILLDEALSHVDDAFAQVCDARFAEWARQGRTMVLVSHDLAFIRRFCRRALWIEDRRLRLSGPVDEVVAAYEAAGKTGQAGLL
jgi:ABC-type polysaccharide/polyol phosphate transport system ATPase subunit